jgi:uroporphyrinogen-III synthase
MDGPLAGRRIVLTRPNRGTLGDRLSALGAAVHDVPLIAIREPSDHGAALAKALDRLDDYDWLVVTSANGAERVGAATRRSPVRLAAVGSATAATLSELAGRPVDLVPSVQRASGLLEVFPREPASILVAQGNLASAELADGLRGFGCDVTVVEAYATVPLRPSRSELDTLRSADVVVLASGSALDAWLTADVGPIAAIVTIGPTTAAAVEHRGLRVAAVAASPSDDDVVAAVLVSIG